MNTDDPAHAQTPPVDNGPKACRNCNALMTGDFCHSCGQAARRSTRMDTRQIVTDFFERLINLDSSFIRTLVGLTTQPGVVCREFVEGKRIRYANPVGYLILASVVLAVVSRLARAAAGGQADAFDIFGENWGTQMGLLICVPMSLFLAKLFRRSGFNLAENYVFTLYILAQLTWVEAIAAPLAVFPAIADFAFLLLLLVGIAYFVIAAKQFYQESAVRIILNLSIAMGVLLAVLFVVRLALIPVWPLEV